MRESKLITSLHPFPPGLADIITPVTIYLKIRDKFPNTILLESSDYHGNSNSMSYICFDVMAEFKAEDYKIHINYPNGQQEQIGIKDKHTLPDIFNSFLKSFIINRNTDLTGMSANGLFGYTTYDAVKYFEDIGFKHYVNEQYKIPDMYYSLYRYIIAINHFNNRIFLVENLLEGNESRIDEVKSLLRNRSLGAFQFMPLNNECSNITDEEYIEMVSKGKKHCFLGDVFQVVLSRQFSQQFHGDEFNVYRALRNINPSPYLFYFDYGGYKLFGSSPEAQLVIDKGIARINPIAGTFKRSGDDEEDRQLAIDLTNDRKENAEHVMLVDLARNDLSRNSDNVVVKTFREVQFYSHVIHLVSEVTGELKEGFNPIKIFGDSFPAGTLSGAPKFKAMELIDKIENRNRGFYGGAIGYIGFNGDINHAIMIRSFLSRNNTLYYQAGAGIVAASVEENELNEVNNKLGALKAAIAIASGI
ncbi:MAG: chorismate-binding protein [Bacteroidales bacterium]|nr:chorismate-binding protein [Bacteroidales bacterium]MDP3003291.1 chorismate-binding protein [Bacteroidales bacterium]